MGYKTEQFVGKVDDHLICAICHEVLQDPWQCKDGHAFCKECITEWLKTNQKCPLDNKPLQVNNLVHTLIAKNMIDNLDVYCHPPENDRPTAAREGTCAWTGNLQLLAKHRETCPFQQVQCANENCNEMMQRRELEDHDKICKFKRVTCEKCNKDFIRHVLQIHIDVECPEVLVPCPNGCTISPQEQTTEIKRVDLNNHLTKICAKTIVDCPFKDQGCSVQVERQDVEKHVQDNMAAHMMLLAKQCSSLTKDNLSLTEQNSLLTKQCSSLTSQCSSLAKKNQALKDELKEVKAQLSSTNTYTWVIYDFPALCDNHPNGSGCRSPTFWLCGYKLCLWIYPNGENKDASGFISLYLDLNQEYSFTYDQVTKIPNSESTLKFRLSMISQKRFTPDESFEVTHVFKEPESWGLPEFIQTADALSADYCNRIKRSLTITCTILLDKP